MGKFTIQPHGRLQEWIAHEKGYFRDEGLDYEFARGPSSDPKKNVDARGKVTESSPERSSPISMPAATRA